VAIYNLFTSLLHILGVMTTTDRSKSLHTQRASLEALSFLCRHHHTLPCAADLPPLSRTADMLLAAMYGTGPQHPDRAIGLL